MSHLKVGDTVPENAYTSYDTLDQLIARFNRLAAKRFPAKAIDVRIVAVRDALAHGRIWADSPGPPLRLLKFSKPKDGIAKVQFAEVMSIDWLNSQTARLSAELGKVASVSLKAPRKKRVSKGAS